MWKLALLFIFPLAVQAKPTAATVSNSVEIALKIDYAPRQSPELVNMILLNPLVQQCLRAFPGIRETNFEVGIEGLMNAQGRLQKISVAHSDKVLRRCLVRECTRLKITPGPSGPLKLVLTRNFADIPKAKPVSLELGVPPANPKKWE